MYELMLATTVSVYLSIAEGTSLVWLFIVGASSVGKTATADLLRGSPHVANLTTMASPASMTSSAKDGNGAKAKSLLASWDQKALIITDLGAMFSQDDKKVKATLGALTAAFDGHYDKGHGLAFGDESPTDHIESRMAMIGCIKPDHVQEHENYMTKLGSRVLMYRITGAGQKSPLGKAERAAVGKDLQRLTREWIEHARARVLDVVLPWSFEEHAIGPMVDLIRWGRTPVLAESYINTDGLKRYETTFGSTEEPPRLRQQLATLARCLAAVRGRGEVTPYELETVRRVAVSSIPTRRAQILAAFRTVPVPLPEMSMTLAQVAEHVPLTKPALLYHLGHLVDLGILDKVDKPTPRYQVRKDYWMPVLGDYRPDPAVGVWTESATVTGT
jgi:hypothetical protein